MKAIILARVSTEEQKEAGNSLPAQVFRLETYCKQKNFEIIKSYSFDESAYKDKRDDFDKVIEYLESSKEKIVICFDKVDRFSRNVFDKRVSYLYEMAMNDRIELHFASDNLVITSKISAVEKFHFGINLGLAKYYSDAISDNVKRSFEQKLRKGKWIGWAPLGYKNVKDEDGNADIVPHPEKAELVKKMFEFYASGSCSMPMLSKKMAEMGLLNGNGKPLPVSHVEHTLKNPFYYGIMEKDGKQYPHKYEPLISMNLFLKCQKVRQSWNKKPFQYAAKPFTFRGLAVCDVCGCTITPEMSKGKYIYYRCTNYRGLCKKLYVPEKVFLDAISEDIRQLQLPQDGIDYVVDGMKTSSAAEQEFYKSQLVRLQAEHNKYTERLSKLIDEKFDGSITPEIYDKKLKEYKSKQADILQQMQEHDKADENYHVTAARILDICKRAADIFESSEPNEKRQFLNFIVQNCRLRAKTPMFTLKPAFAGIVSAHKNHNWQGR